MEYKAEWQTEEEGSITFYEEGKVFLKAVVFITGEEEAEFRIQDVVLPENRTKSDNMQEDIISKMTSCVLESFRHLWEEGFEESILVERQGTKVAEILDSTNVVRLAYSEYMMKRHLEPQKPTDCGSLLIKLTKDEKGLRCENKEGTFFCRLLPYGKEPSGEDRFYLYEVEVSKEKRNKGIATACLRDLFRQLSETAPVTIYLQVGSYNEPAVHLYQKLGFQISEELRYYAPEE